VTSGVTSANIITFSVISWCKVSVFSSLHQSPIRIRVGGTGCAAQRPWRSRSGATLVESGRRPLSLGTGPRKSSVPCHAQKLVTNLVVLSQPFVVHSMGSKDVGRSICMGQVPIRSCGFSNPTTGYLPHASQSANSFSAINGTWSLMT